MRTVIASERIFLRIGETVKIDEVLKLFCRSRPRELASDLIKTGSFVAKPLSIGNA